jgi:hypothetical protein
MSQYLPIAVRAHTEPIMPRKMRRAVARQQRRKEWSLPKRVLVFDCETDIDTGQQLSFGSYRYCRLDPDTLRLELIEEGLFHDDELELRDPPGYATLAEYAEERGLQLMSRRVFVERVFWRCAYQARAWVVGFNLPFDLSRLAVAFGEARGRYRGGHSLVLWDYEAADGSRLENRFRPRILVKSIDSKRAFIGFAGRRDPDIDDLIPDDSSDGHPGASFRFRGHFLDLRTLAFALTNRSHSLASACSAFAVEQGKQEADEHGVISPEYVDYNRQDVRATGSLFEKLIGAYRQHPIALQPTKLDKPFQQNLSAVETPGAYSFPPLAACITGAARLMLALLERLVTDAGGHYAFCDTDSMAIVATPDGRPAPNGQTITALSCAQVDGIINRFATLNPYNPGLVGGSILELEEWNFDPNTGERRQLYCHAISAKRYALYNREGDRLLLRKPSEHGLGHLLNPLNPDVKNRDLARHVWQQILDDAHRGH